MGSGCEGIEETEGVGGIEGIEGVEETEGVGVDWGRSTRLKGSE